MAREIRFSSLLPAAQFWLAALFGGIGLWQRSAILSRPFLEGQTMWNTTARFHVWPWPYKFAVICNFPAFLLGLLPSWPLGLIWPALPEYVANIPVLFCVLLIWSWVGSRLDARWRVSSKTPWIGLLIFMLISLGCALLPIGYNGYLPCGLALWLVTTVVIRLVSKPARDTNRAD
jgi:type IV secretory pathway TrbD component